MRCFIAIGLPEDVRARIFHEFEILKDSGVAVANFVEKNNLHLTLKFLGDLSENQIEKIKLKLKEISDTGFQKFDAETKEVGFFPSDEYIKVLWVELLSDRNAVHDLQKLVENKLTDLDIKKSDKEFSSHITVARIKSVKNKDLFREKLKKVKIKRNKFTIEEFLFIKSELTREGPVYKIIDKFPLR